MGMLKFKPKSKAARAGLAVGCLSLAFIGWGLLASAVGSSTAHSGNSTESIASITAEKAAQLSDSERELLLNDPKPKKNKSTAKESSVIFNDPFIQNKWGLERTSAQKAWQITQGSKDIVVAIIDTGADINHRDLAENIWVNPGESGIVDSKECHANEKLAQCDKSSNGIDDDANGFIDDVHGWDFVHNGNNLVDNHGHGTHIAGIIGARGGNSYADVSGVAPNISLMILKYYDPKSSNSNNLRNTIQAIRYAIKMKARIINYSGGGTDYSAEEFAAVKDAEKAGILFVAAAGNEKSNSDEAGKHYYPADYGLTNIISVTAVNREENKVLSSSNYGVRTVDIAAPGENIYSTLPNNSFGLMTGTSQATAFATGVAALVMSRNHDFDFAEVKKYVLKTGDEYPNLLSKTGSSKLLNSYQALVKYDMGVNFAGTTATNTTPGARAFSSDQNIHDIQLNTSVLSTVGDANDEPAESIAMFGKDFLKAVQAAGVNAPEVNKR